MADKLVGQNYTTPDLIAKVTGKSKYAEDFRVEGMLFAKLLLSPHPHARVTRIDTSAAMAVPGVKAILTADDLPAPADAVNDNGQLILANIDGEVALTKEPVYQGQPILAIAAIDEASAAEAIERIEITYETLPFVVDPLVSLRPGGPNARTKGNYWFIPPPIPPGTPPPKSPPRPEIKEMKWTAAELTDADAGRLPMMKDAPEAWAYGDLDAGFKEAALVLDETFVTPDTSHQTLETRTAMAYWQNGKLYMHCSTQSVMRTVNAVARWVGIDPANVVIISEYTGGGFGSKGSSSVFTAVAALLSKKANAPVMMRITREDEQNIGRARPALHSRIKIGFRKDGRVTALDGFVVVDNGPYDVVGDSRSAGDHISLCFQPLAMRWRSLTVLTNTPPRGAQRAPGGMQGNALMAPIMVKAARKLGIDEVAIHRINAPEGKAAFGAPNARGRQNYTTSAFLKNALDKGAELFKWEERKALSGKRNGSKVRGVGVAVSAYSAGSMGFDGLLVVKPDGRVMIQSGIGNLGTESVFDCHRVAAEILNVAWEQCDVTWGNTSKNVPNTCGQGGSQTTHAMTRAAHAAATDAKKKLQEIAAKTFGGNPESYQLTRGGISGGGRTMTLAQAAKKAIELGGKYDGHELPQDVNNYTKNSAKALVGQGLMGVARDNYGRDGTSKSYVAGFAEVEVDVETGVYKVLDYVAVADVGTVIHPRNLGGQILGGVMLGLGHAHAQHWVFDQQYGVAVARRFYQTKPPTILDAPARMQWAAVEIADPETPVGARGVGESPVGAGFGAIVNAIAAAVGDEVFKRAPVTADKILLALEHGRPMHEPLMANV